MDRTFYGRAKIWSLSLQSKPTLLHIEYSNAYWLNFASYVSKLRTIQLWACPTLFQHDRFWSGLLCNFACKSELLSAWPHKSLVSIKKVTPLDHHPRIPFTKQEMVENSFSELFLLSRFTFLAPFSFSNNASPPSQPQASWGMSGNVCSYLQSPES